MKVLVNLHAKEANSQGIVGGILRDIGAKAIVSYRELDLSTAKMLAKKHKCDAIVTSNQATINNVTPGEGKKGIDDWRGSVLQTTVPILIINPLSYIHSKNDGRWVLHNDLMKLRHIKYGSTFLYDLKVCHQYHEVVEAEEYLSTFPCLTVDIETTLTNNISSIAFTPISEDLTIGKSFTIPLLPKHVAPGEDVERYLMEAWGMIRRLLAYEPITKVFHNGCFDNFHLIRYHCPTVNWVFDTEYMWHVWEAESKKSLAYISSILLPDYYYWKHESTESPLEYNAKDTINTARVFIALLRQMPMWAWRNYAKTIPNAIPIIKTMFEGFRVDVDKKDELKSEAVAKRDDMQQELESLTGIKGFNAGSPQQVHHLIYKVLGAKRPARAKSASATGEIELKKVAMQHPLLLRIVHLVLGIREERKAISTYYDARLTATPYSKLLYALQLDGTETERMACKSSSLWAPFPNLERINKSNAKNLGTQAQNLPYYYKKAIMAEEGYEILEIDKSQSEARCTSKLSGDAALIRALEDPPETAGVKDFYCYTGYLFFGVEFDKEHDLRQIVKKIIHGTNYMMGAQTFIDSVGILNMQKYRKLVGFKGTIKEFAAYLLGLYHEAYPEVKHWWDRIVNEIAQTGKLVTPDGWTRKFYGNINSSHAIKRSAVAHCSQHLSVRGVNEAFWRVFYEIEVPTTGAYRLKAQIHDSLVGQVKEKMKHQIADEIVLIMSKPQDTPSGPLVIPLDVEGGKYWKGNKEAA